MYFLFKSAELDWRKWISWYCQTIRKDGPSVSCRYSTAGTRYLLRDKGDSRGRRVQFYCSAYFELLSRCRDVHLLCIHEELDHVQSLWIGSRF
jgi:hypothetical protein